MASELCNAEWDEDDAGSAADDEEQRDQRCKGETDVAVFGLHHVSSDIDVGGEQLCFWMRQRSSYTRLAITPRPPKC